MLTADRYREVVAANVDAISAVAAGHLDAGVEHCPGFDVGQLLEHTGAFCRIVNGRVIDDEWTPASGNWQESSSEVGSDPLAWHRRWGAALVASLRTANPSESVRTWAGQRTRYFWFRRAAQELTIHRFDAEHAVGATTAIDPIVALDGLDEFLGEFGKRAAPLFGGSGETFLFIAQDVGAAYAVTTRADGFELHAGSTPDVTARAPAEVLYRFVWGRATADDLDVSGDAGLVARWHELVRV